MGLKRAEKQQKAPFIYVLTQVDAGDPICIFYAWTPLAVYTYPKGTEKFWYIVHHVASGTKVMVLNK